MAFPKVLVISNYLPDKQKSMIKYANMLVQFYSPVSDVDLVSPLALATRLWDP